MKPSMGRGAKTAKCQENSIRKYDQTASSAFVMCVHKYSCTCPAHQRLAELLWHMLLTCITNTQVTFNQSNIQHALLTVMQDVRRGMQLHGEVAIHWYIPNECIVLPCHKHVVAEVVHGAHGMLVNFRVKY